MKIILWRSLFFLVLIFPCGVQAAAFEQGKDYVLLENVTPPPITDEERGKVKVLEFFSYGCPWCAKLESSVDSWLLKKSNNIFFERVPVTFESGWENFSKAYYTAKALGVETKLTPQIFKAVQEQKLSSEEKELSAFFESHGVSKQDFDSAFNFSPQIGMQLKQAQSLMQTYKVYQVPSFIIADKYKTNLVMAKGDPVRLIAIVQYLTQKEKK